MLGSPGLAVNVVGKNDDWAVAGQDASYAEAEKGIHLKPFASNGKDDGE